MSYRIASLAKYKKIIGVIVAAGLLTAIFVPFQGASAFTVNIDIPSSITQSVSGTEFSISIEVAPAELVSMDTVTLELDGASESSSQFVFDVEGDTAVLTSGDETIMSDLTISTSDGSGYGYGYGYGLVSSNSGFDYSYSYGFIGNNPYGYSYSYGLTDFVNGFVGPATITLSGVLKTAQLSVGDHTIQAFVDTGAANVNQILVSPIVSFTINASGEVFATLNVFSKDADTGDRLDGNFMQVVQGTTEIDNGFTSDTDPLEFTLVVGDAYTIYANDFTNEDTGISFIFDHWDRSDTANDDNISTRGLAFTMEAGLEVTAFYDVVSGVTLVDLPVTSEDENGDEITGLFNKVVEGTGITPVIDSGFTPYTYSLISGTEYTIYASDFEEFIFDHWEDQDGDTVTHTNPIFTRGATFTAGGGITSLVAVYDTLDVPLVAVTVDAEDEDGDPIDNVFVKVTEADDTTVIIDSGFTPYTFQLEDDTDYKVFVSDFSIYSFKEWDDGSLERGREFNTGDTTEMTATFKTLTVEVVTETVDTDTEEITFDIVDEDGDPIVLESGEELVLKINFGGDIIAGGQVAVSVKTGDEFVEDFTEEQLDDLGIEIKNGKVVFKTDSGKKVIAGVFITIDVSGLVLGEDPEVDIQSTYDSTDLTPGQERKVRILHFEDGEWVALDNLNEDINDGKEVDIDEDLVFGTATKFSLFVPGVDEEVAPSGGGGGGGGGGTVVITWPKVATQDPEHFINFPLERMQVSSSAFLNAAGVMITEATVGQQLSISGDFANYQQVSQDYAFIVQIIDEDGFVTDISFQQGTLGSGSTAKVSTLWTPEEAGTYKVQIFIWNGLSLAPEPLSEVTAKNIPVS